MIISWLRDGLGNQMFRYAAGRRLALKLGVEFKICTAWFDKYPWPDPYQLNYFNIYENFATLDEVEDVKRLRLDPSLGQESKDKNFDPEVLDYPDNVVLFGARLSERYFSDIKEVIRNDFSLKKFSNDTARWKQQINNDPKESVSIHFRRNFFEVSDDRSDAVGTTRDRLKYAGTCSVGYYQKALKLLEERVGELSLYIFSDNVEWVQKNFKTNHSLHFVTGTIDAPNPAVEEMFLMSQCRHNIIPNSSFSWWGAWLNRNPNKMVIAPKYFLNKEGFSDHAKDIMCDDWIILDNTI